MNYRFESSHPRSNPASFGSGLGNVHHLLVVCVSHVKLTSGEPYSFCRFEQEMKQKDLVYYVWKNTVKQDCLPTKRMPTRLQTQPNIYFPLFHYWARQRAKTGKNPVQGDKFWIKVLRIVCQVDALIAKVAANLENAVEATNDEPRLYGDTQIYFWGAGPSSETKCYACYANSITRGMGSSLQILSSLAACYVSSFLRAKADATGLQVKTSEHRCCFK